jgi:chromosome segregation ATPase
MPKSNHPANPKRVHPKTRREVQRLEAQLAELAFQESGLNRQLRTAAGDLRRQLERELNQLRQRVAPLRAAYTWGCDHYEQLRP